MTRTRLPLWLLLQTGLSTFSFLCAQPTINGLTISLLSEPPASENVRIANGAGRFGAGKTSLRYTLNKVLKGTAKAGDHTRFARQTGVEGR